MISIGDMLYLHDHDTKVSNKNVMRWCMVIAIAGSTVRVTPRSTTVRGKVFTSASLMPEFTADGWFKRYSRSVPLSLATRASNIGQLPEPERSQVLALFSRSGP